MSSNVKLLLLILCTFILLSTLRGQTYETTGVVALGSGILSSETYNTVIILGDPSASDDMLEGENISGNSGFIFVEEEPFTLLGASPPVDLVIFPNPVSNFLTIRTEQSGNGEYLVRVLSLDGKVQLWKKWSTGRNRPFFLDVSHLITSVYILSITTSDGETHHYRFSKD